MARNTTPHVGLSQSDERKLATPETGAPAARAGTTSRVGKDRLSIAHVQACLAHAVASRSSRVRENVKERHSIWSRARYDKATSRSANAGVSVTYDYQQKPEDNPTNEKPASRSQPRTRPHHPVGRSGHTPPAAHGLTALPPCLRQA